MRLPMLGRTYRYVYGYSWRYAFTAEIAWRLEHFPLLRRCSWPYLWRKNLERAATGN